MEIYSSIQVMLCFVAGSESWYFLDNLFVILCDFLEPINARQVFNIEHIAFPLLRVSFF